MVSAPLRVFLFAALMLVVHVVAVQLLYRRALDGRERWQMSLVTSTALPLLVAISEIGLRNGTMLPENAAALVGAGVLTVLVFPALAVVLRRPPIVSDAPTPSASRCRPAHRRGCAWLPVRRDAPAHARWPCAHLRSLAASASR